MARFALQRLQARHNALRATLLLSIGWGLWHVPSFFGNSGFADFGPVDMVVVLAVVALVRSGAAELTGVSRGAGSAARPAG